MEDNDFKRIICNYRDKNDDVIGEQIVKGGIQVHYLCLLSSTYIPQKI